jgi:transcriptional regulator with XRE-family HTH domain
MSKRCPSSQTARIKAPVSVGQVPPGSFNEWLASQLRTQRMSYGQLAQSSGVDKSTIWRLVHGNRGPRLDTAAKLARALRARWDDTESLEQSVGAAVPASHPTMRVEYALRSDELLNEAQVQQLMNLYLSIRAGRPTTKAQPPRGAGSSGSMTTLRRIQGRKPK